MESSLRKKAAKLRGGPTRWDIMYHRYVLIIHIELLTILRISCKSMQKEWFYFLMSNQTLVTCFAHCQTIDFVDFVKQWILMKFTKRHSNLWFNLKQNGSHLLNRWESFSNLNKLEFILMQFTTSVHLFI